MRRRTCPTASRRHTADRPGRAAGGHASSARQTPRANRPAGCARCPSRRRWPPGAPRAGRACCRCGRLRCAVCARFVHPTRRSARGARRRWLRGGTAAAARRPQTWRCCFAWQPGCDRLRRFARARRPAAPKRRTRRWSKGKSGMSTSRRTTSGKVEQKGAGPLGPGVQRHPGAYPERTATFARPVAFDEGAFPMPALSSGAATAA
jgi:hypothetical protein